MDPSDFFLSKLKDAARQCRFGHNIFLGFLDEKERLVAENFFCRIKDVSVTFWGGTSDAQRVFAGISAEGEVSREDFPIEAVTFRFNPEYELSHRDFLGAAMSQNFSRDVIGDICIDSGLAVMFVRQGLACVLANDIRKIGRIGISASMEIPDVIPPSFRLSMQTGVVSSPRFDCVVAMLTGCGRNTAADLIKSGLCTLDFSVCKNVSATVRDSAVISVRGRGKYRITEFGDLTKKGRMKVSFGRYV